MAIEVIPHRSQETQGFLVKGHTLHNCFRMSRETQTRYIKYYIILKVGFLKSIF